jgi:hypothetical protein
LKKAMKRLKIVILGIVAVISLQADIVHAFKEKTAPLLNKAKTIGKATSVPIEVYVKNPSSVCTLSFTNKISPYGYALESGSFSAYTIAEGRYVSESLPSIKKGRYEFEVVWQKEGKIVDSLLKSVHVFAYHDVSNKFHKKVDLSFRLKVPTACR